MNESQAESPNTPQHDEPPGVRHPHCAAHIAELAIAGCARCGNYLCAVCAIPSEEASAFFCRDCKVKLEEAGSLGRVPWELRRGGFLGQYWRTVGQVLSAPTRFFGTLPSQGYVSAITFLYNTMAYAMVLSFLSSWLTIELMPALPQHLKGQLLGNVAVTLVGAAAVAPILAFVSSGWVHLHLLLFGAQRGFETTYRAMAYLSATYFVAIVVQLVGMGLGEVGAAMVLTLVLVVLVLSWMTIALMQAQRLPSWAATLAVAMLAGEAFALWFLLVRPAIKSASRMGFG